MGSAKIAPIMQIKFDIKPTVIDKDFMGRTYNRADIRRKIADYTAGAFRRDVVVAYNMQKWRRKSATVLKKKRVNGKYTMVPTRVSIRDKTYWTANVYTFPQNLLDMAGLRVVQYKHHFTLIKTKKKSF